MMRTALFLVAAVVATGCSARSARLADCPGTVAATVRNNWNYPVDVYADTRAGGLILGEVSPGGRDEFPLPANTGRVYIRWRAPGAVPNPTSSDVHVSYACR